MVCWLLLPRLCVCVCVCVYVVKYVNRHQTEHSVCVGVSLLKLSVRLESAAPEDTATLVSQSLG